MKMVAFENDADGTSTSERWKSLDRPVNARRLQ